MNAASFEIHIFGGVTENSREESKYQTKLEFSDVNDGQWEFPLSHYHNAQSLLTYCTKFVHNQFLTSTVHSLNSNNLKWQIIIKNIIILFSGFK